MMVGDCGGLGMSDTFSVRLRRQLDGTKAVECGTDTTESVEVVQAWIDMLERAKAWLAEQHKE